jgi:hypothetical protein
MSPRSTLDIRSAPVMTRQLWAADPDAARIYAAECRSFAADKAADADSDRDRRIAVALHRAADAAAGALAELEKAVA